MTVFVVLNDSPDELPVVDKRGLDKGKGWELGQAGHTPALFNQDQVGDVLKFFNASLGLKKLHFVVKGCS